MFERCPGSKPMFTATLPNYKLVFADWSRQWKGGVASLKSLRGEKVLGAVYEVSAKDMGLLDSYEGHPSKYNRLNVRVFDEDGAPIEAVTYVKAGTLEETQPSKEYLAIIQQGYRDWGIAGIKT